MVKESIEIAKHIVLDFLEGPEPHSSLVDVHFVALYSSSLEHFDLTRHTAESLLKIFGKHITFAKNYRFSKKGVFLSVDMPGVDADLAQEAFRRPKIGYIKVDSPIAIRVRRTWCELELVPYESVDDNYLLYGPTRYGMDKKVLSKEVHSL